MKKTAAVLTEGHKPEVAVNVGITKQAGQMVEANKMKINRDKYIRCSWGWWGHGEGEGGK